MRDVHRQAFINQRLKALTRGIEWQLTFDEWLAWWGEDISRRGSGPRDLQMQRPGDQGPYALGNIRKGTPKENAVTAGHMKRTNNAKKAAERLVERKDAMLLEESPEDETREDIGAEMGLGYARVDPDWMPREAWHVQFQR